MQAMEHAVANGNDELLLQVLGQHVLASTYLSEWWDGVQNVEVLLELDCPLRIFHGDLDANCRVEGVHEAASAFEEAGLDDEAAVTETGRRFRDTVLAMGGSRHPMQIFREFRGREPTVEALLRHSGLADS